MSATETKPAEQAIIDDLKAHANSHEDHATLDTWQQELNEARTEATRQLGTGTVRLVDQGDGTIATSHEIDQARAAGQEPSAVYKGGRR